MTREDFLKKMVMMGAAAPFMSALLSSCSKREDEQFFRDIPTGFNGKVLIIGAGAAGLFAGYILRQYQIDFEIIEAAPVWGGRVKAHNDFVDFPIDLGAEWIHTDPSILAKLLNDDGVNANIDIVRYRPKEISVYHGGKLRRRNYFSNFYAEHKFKSTTWHSYFENYVVPPISDRLNLGKPVSSIDYSGNNVVVSTTDGTVFTGSKVLVTVPLTVLQDGDIAFTPALPASKTAALKNVEMPDGIKVFMEFSERFYPDLVMPYHLLDGPETGEVLYYDAAFGKDATRNVLALFTVGDPATQYASIASDAELMDYMLNELDEIFNGKARQTYVQHSIQNWSKEPYIRGSYSHYGDNRSATMNAIREPINSTVYFAGEAVEDANQSTVHGAGISAYNALRDLLA